MFPHDAGNIDDIVPKICEDKLLRGPLQVKDKCVNFLRNVEVPSGWKDESYKLDEHLPTYKYRLQILKAFVTIKEEGNEFVTSTTSCEEFFHELKQFSLDSRNDDEFWANYNGQRCCPGVDLFQQNTKLQGVVVRKSENWLKASVLVKKEGQGEQTGLGLTSDSLQSSELVVSLQHEDQAGEEFHLKVSVGDIVEVTKCTRKEGEALEPEVVMCYSLSEDEIQSYLKCLSSCVKSGHSTAAVNEISRCRAAWNYVLELSKEKYDVNIILQILETVNKISSSSLVSHTINKIVEGFQQSSFFRTILPDFIDKITEINCFSLVQNVLEHVISAVPQSGLQILTLAKNLAYKHLEVSSDSETPKVIVDFLIQLSTIIASEVPGARKDIKELPWKKLPLIPNEEEMKEARSNTDDLPVIKKDRKYDSEDDYLNTYSRLLREECFHKLRKGISNFVFNGQKCDSKDLRMYRISLKGASLCHEDSPTPVSMRLEYKGLDTQGNSDMEDTEGLLYGNLLCISIDGTFQEPVWAVVDRCIAKQSIVGITLCEKGNAISEPQFIAKMQEISNRGEEAFMAESQTFYLSYAPALEVLQNRDYVPFKDFLVFPDPKLRKPAEYTKQIKSPPDWGIIFKRDSLPERSIQDEHSEKYSLLEDFDKLRLNGSCKSHLDESQLAAVELALRNELVLIQGPPGTGKSYVGMALVNLLLSMNVPHDHGPILVVTCKNHALDNFMTDCVKKVSSPDVKIVRVGRVREDTNEELKKFLLREVGRRWPQRLFNQKRKLSGQIWALQPEVKRAFEKLRYSSSFTADMFLEEATASQLKSLLIGSQQIKEGELDDLMKERPKTEAKLRELVQKVLRVWLPTQNVFNTIAQTMVNEKGSSPENSSPEKDKGNQMEDQGQVENPSDFSDPSVEQNERLLAVDEEITDDDDKVIAAKLESQAAGSSPAIEFLRSLVCVDKSKVESFKDLLDVSNVWTLKESKRVQLVYALQSKFYDKASAEFLTVSGSYAELHHQLKELKNQHDIEVMRKCDVIGMTVTGATMRANLLDDIKPSVMIVEEAAEILEGQLVAVIPPSVKHLIMIGDYKQLKPIVHLTRLRTKHFLDVSMFERLVNCNLPFIQLRYQCRMRDEFVDLLRKLKIYDELKTNEELVKFNTIPPCVTRSMYFWTHTEWEEEDKFSHSKRNCFEAKKITEVAKTFCQEGGVPPSKITVLCSYRGQVLEIKKRFQFTNIPALENITVTTIDSFQGQENDIILISLVRSSSKGNIGYLSQMNRLCVAISRARCGLYLFGNHTHLGRFSTKGWKVVSDAMGNGDCRGKRFPFRLSEDPNIPKQGESGPVGSSPTRETESKNVINISGNDNYIIIGDRTVTTINIRNDDTGKMASTTKDAREPIQQFEKSGETRFHAPLSTQEAGSDTRELESSTKDAREPFQEVEKSTEPERLDVEAGSPTKEAREPIQVCTSKDGAEGQRTFISKVQAPFRIVQEGEAATVQARLPASDAQALIQELESSIKEARDPIQEVSPLNKEAAMPTEVTSEGEGSHGLPEMEGCIESRAQGSMSRRSDEQLPSEDGSIRSAVEESKVTKGKEVELEVVPGRRQVFQEGDLEDLSKGKEEQDFEEFDKGKPLQETQETGKEKEEPSGGKPLQESESSSEVKNESPKKDSTPAQETMAAGKGPFGSCN